MTYIRNIRNDFFLDIAKRSVVGHSSIHKFGQTPDFDTDDGEVNIWDGANDAGIDQMTYTFVTGATIDSLSSSNDTDTQDIEVQGLDSGYTLTTQTITLSGQTRVALDTPLIRAFRLKNEGSTDLSGDAYCYENTAITNGVPDDKSTIKAMINNGNNQTLMLIYTIPAGKTGYLKEWDVTSAGASKSSEYIVRLKTRKTGGVFQLKHISSISDDAGPSIFHSYVIPIQYTEKTDIMITVEATGLGVTGANISGSMDIILIDD